MTGSDTAVRRLGSVLGTVLVVATLAGCGSDDRVAFETTATNTEVEEVVVEPDEGIESDETPPLSTDVGVEADPSGATPSGEDADAAETVGVPGFDRDRFCEVAAETQQVVERPFVGSDAHIALFDDLIAVAPEDLLDELVVLRDHFDLDVDPANPASQDFPNFSPAVQDTIMSVQGYISDRC